MISPAETSELTWYSFATGWNYFFKYIIATPTNLTAAGLVIQFWRPDLNVAIWITIFGVAIVTVNVSSLKAPASVLIVSNKALDSSCQ